MARAPIAPAWTNPRHPQLSAIANSASHSMIRPTDSEPRNPDVASERRWWPTLADATDNVPHQATPTGPRTAIEDEITSGYPVTQALVARGQKAQITSTNSSACQNEPSHKLTSGPHRAQISPLNFRMGACVVAPEPRIAAVPLASRNSTGQIVIRTRSG